MPVAATSSSPSHGTGGLAGLTLAALGIVYGDIGTSPLYSLRETFSEHHDIPVEPTSVLGALSLIFWSLIIVVTIKYVFVVMRADNEGEGGILALTALVASSDEARRRRRQLVFAGIVGAAMLYGDGAITPAISVLSAVEGLRIVTPSFAPYVIPASVIILVGLFAIQRRGTELVGRIFGPVMVVWFAVIALLGIVATIGNPEVLAALNPWYAVKFFTTYSTRAFIALGAVVLVVTGGEALYADMGHFGVRPIRFGWLAVVLPALVLNYLGQGALLLQNPAAVESPFFLLAPEWALLPVVILATLATIVASQALISGVFSLTNQAIQLGFVPRLEVRHTSADVHGQIYLPAINWTLMVACVGLVLGFGSSTNLAAAYGVAVTATMLITTVLLAVYAREHWRWGMLKIGLIIGGLGLVDLAFFTSNLLKVPQGGWFPIVLAALVTFVMTTWIAGRRYLHEKIKRGRQPQRALIKSLTESNVPRTQGTAVYLFGTPGAIPPAFLSNLRHNHAIHESIVFLAVRMSRSPRVHRARREEIEHLGSRFYQVTLNYGFMEEPNVPAALDHLIAEVAFNANDTTYFLGKERVVASKGVGLHGIRERLFDFLHRNTRSAADYFKLPPERVVDIGVVVEI